MDKYYIKLFLRFLKENDAYDKYHTYTLKKTTDDIFNHPLTHLLTNSHRGWSWGETDEGRVFWKSIHIKWLRALCNNPKTLMSDRLRYEKEIVNFLDY